MGRRGPAIEDQINASRRAGRELANAMAAGANPRTVAVRVALRPGEDCFGWAPVVVSQWLEGDGSYMHKSGGWGIGGGVLGVAFSAASITSNLVGNSARKAAAAREAMARWRPIDQGYVYVTNRRFCIQGASQFNDIWFDSIRVSDCDSRSIILHPDGIPPLALGVDAADYWFVVFNKMAYGTIVMPPPPTDEVVALPSQPIVGDTTEAEPTSSGPPAIEAPGRRTY